MPPFMLEIEAAQRSPLDQLAVDYLALSSRFSIDLCRRLNGIPQPDDVVARRLGVATSTIRAWREIGRRADAGTLR